MLCPVCGWQNFLGEETCDNCGADLRNADIPEPATSFHGRLLGAHLDELGAPAPELVDADARADETVARMRHDGVDCLLVMEHGKLAGIFTDRDAILKMAGGHEDPRPVRELMTPDPVILRRDDPIAVAINKMAVGGFRHVPIADRGIPTAVVSARDVFRHISSRLG